MSKTTQYSTFEQKKDFFKVEKIETRKELDFLLEKLSNSKDSIFRGSSESKYKLYTSLQRFWIQRNLPDDIDQVIKYLDYLNEKSLHWNNDFLKRYFENYNVEFYNIFSILSILRHHGAPTPLLDWTINPKVALFFGANFSTVYETNNEIENYFTLYELRNEHTLSKFDFKQIPFDYFSSIKEDLSIDNPKTKNDSDFIENLTRGYIRDKDQFFKKIKNGILTFKIQDKLDDKVEFGINNNYNITAQEGLFVFNADPLKPIEQCFYDKVKSGAEKSNITYEKLDDLMKNNHDNFISYEIHKNLKQYLLFKLNELPNPINYRTLFPDMNEMAKEVTNDILVNWV